MNDLFRTTDKVQDEKDELKQVLKFAAYQPYYYRQIDGVAMGATLGPTFANAHYGKQWISNCPLSFQFQIFRRYVDDIFVTFTSQVQLKSFVNYMNKQRPNIKFIFQVEQSNTFSLLVFVGKILWRFDIILHVQ